jgi:hypothetical protein
MRYEIFGGGREKEVLFQNLGRLGMGPANMGCSGKEGLRLGTVALV